MNSKKALILLILIVAINTVFFSFEKPETILFSVVFIVLGILILRLSVKRTKMFFLLSAISLIIIEITTFYMLSETNKDLNLKEILVKNSKWTWNLDNVNYSISIKNDSIYFYDENEFIDKFFFKVDRDEIYFNSKEGERFMWKVIEAKNNRLKIKDDADIILLRNIKM